MTLRHSARPLKLSILGSAFGVIVIPTALLAMLFAVAKLMH